MSYTRLKQQLYIHCASAVVRLTVAIAVHGRICPRGPVGIVADVRTAESPPRKAERAMSGGENGGDSSQQMAPASSLLLQLYRAAAAKASPAAFSKKKVE